MTLPPCMIQSPSISTTYPCIVFPRPPFIVHTWQNRCTSVYYTMGSHRSAYPRVLFYLQSQTSVLWLNLVPYVRCFEVSSSSVAARQSDPALGFRHKCQANGDEHLPVWELKGSWLKASCLRDASALTSGEIFLKNIYLSACYLLIFPPKRYIGGRKWRKTSNLLPWQGPKLLNNWQQADENITRVRS